MSGFENLVGFKNDVDRQHLYYFDFSENTWVECKPIGRLPYNLCKYQFENSDHTFITCIDSYRLTDNLNDVLSNDEMYKEKEWRDNVVKDHEEVDLYENGEWHKMVVAWIKADIIHGVLHLKKRRNTSDLYGYFYKESKKLAKSCSQTPVITEEELQKEKEFDENIIKEKEESHNKIGEIEESLKLYKIKDEYRTQYTSHLKEFLFYDTLPYYQSLKLNNDKKLLSKEDFHPGARLTYEEYLSIDTLKKCMAKLGLHIFNKTADMVSIEDEYTDIKNCCVVLKSDYDAFCNIKIYNATYAKLVCLAPFNDHLQVDCDIIDSIDDKKIFGFKDINDTNPILNSAISDNLFIQTDGDKVTFDGILMNSMPRYILKNSQKYSVIHFPSKKFVLLDHTFIGNSMTFDYETLEETTNSSYKLGHDR